MPLMDLLRRRRACRHYRPEPVPRDALDLVLAAAERAPTASNVPYRHLLVVEDPATIHAVRQVSPALTADAPCLLLILTDVGLALERIGPIGERSGYVDSGAAAENAWLQAIELGLASQFTMTSAPAALAAVLGLPDGLRIDVIMPLGTADDARRPAQRVRRAPATVHQDHFGRPRA